MTATARRWASGSSLALTHVTADNMDEEGKTDRGAGPESSSRARAPTRYTPLKRPDLPMSVNEIVEPGLVGCALWRQGGPRRTSPTSPTERTRLRRRRTQTLVAAVSEWRDQTEPNVSRTKPPTGSDGGTARRCPANARCSPRNGPTMLLSAVLHAADQDEMEQELRQLFEAGVAKRSASGTFNPGTARSGRRPSVRNSAATETTPCRHRETRAPCRGADARRRREFARRSGFRRPVVGDASCRRRLGDLRPGFAEATAGEATSRNRKT